MMRAKCFVEGSHRSRPARETVAWVQPRLHQFGITRVANITGLDRIGIPVVMVARPNGRSLSVTQGKGFTLDDAKASGIMEAVEVHHAERIDHPLRLTSYRALHKAAAVVDPATMARPVASTFGANVRLPWIEARGICSGSPVWVPFELVDLDMRVPHSYQRGCFAGSSNGLASGNTYDEAVAHALCEIIERDAQNLWEHAGYAGTGVDVTTVDDERCVQLLSRFAEAGVEVAVWDATSDLGVATFVAAIADRDGARRIFHAEGSGTHPDRSVALLRALTEAAQSRLTMIAGTRDDQSRNDYQFFRASDRLQAGLAANWNANGDSRSFTDVPSVRNATTAADLQMLLDTLDRHEIPEPLVLDLTSDEFSIPVVKVIVPKLEPDPDFGAVPGERAMRARVNAGAQR